MKINAGVINLKYLIIGFIPKKLNGPFQRIYYLEQNEFHAAAVYSAENEIEAKLKI
jgi:hypothetical protein